MEAEAPVAFQEANLTEEEVRLTTEEKRREAQALFGSCSPLP